MKAAIKKTKAFYKHTSVREKLLILSFVLVCLALWAQNWMARASLLRDQSRAAQSELVNHQQVLDRSEEFAAGLARALERVEPEKTYSSARLSGRIDSLLRAANLATKADIDTVRTTEGEIFDDHNLRVTLKRISLAELIQFNQSLSQHSPYINIESVRIRANRSNPRQLDVNYRINSFELKVEAI